MCFKKSKSGVQEADYLDSLKKNLAFKHSFDVEMSLDEEKSKRFKD